MLVATESITAEIEHAVSLAQQGHRVIWAEQCGHHRSRVAQMHRLEPDFSTRHRGRSAAVRLPNGGQIDLVSSDPAALRGLTADAAFAIDPRPAVVDRVKRLLAAVTHGSPHAQHHLITHHITTKE